MTRYCHIGCCSWRKFLYIGRNQQTIRVTIWASQPPARALFIQQLVKLKTTNILRHILQFVLRGGVLLKVSNVENNSMPRRHHGRSHTTGKACLVLRQPDYISSEYIQSKERSRLINSHMYHLFCIIRNQWYFSGTLYILISIYIITLTHWGRGTHVCASKLTAIGSDNGLSPGRCRCVINIISMRIVNWNLACKYQCQI